jgi:DNA-binding NtrC family response regulator
LTRDTAGFTTEPVSLEAGQPYAHCALELVVVFSPDALQVGERVTLASERLLLVGRDVADGVRVRDRKLSRLHFRVVWDKVHAAFRCGDASSANGTFINGVAVDSALLGPGDVVRAGDTLFVCSEGDRSAELRARARRLATSPLPLLLRGPTGAGKERLARAVHADSGRRGAFVAVNCAALPAELVGSELFGHARGAFSGAGEGRRGLFRAAEGGTLLLDEIGDLPLDLQGQLLRVLQDGKIRPVGSDQECRVDVRVMAATHVDLEAAMARGRFRADLAYRLGQLVLDVPPLRQRRAEILPLLGEFAPGIRFAADAAESLLLAEWPGNVRELASFATWLTLDHGRDCTLRAVDLAERLASARTLGARARHAQSTPSPVLESGVVDRRQLLTELLSKHRGNVTSVAHELGKPRAQVYRWMHRFGVSQERFR